MITVKFKQPEALSYDGVNSWKYAAGKSYTARNAYENNYFQHMIDKGVAERVTQGQGKAKQTKVNPPKATKTTK